MFSSRQPRGSHLRLMATENPIAFDIENGSAGADPQLQDLLPFTIGDRTFAVFTEHVDGTAEAKPFAPLPRAPNAVIGVVCVRGRMLTVLDPTLVFEARVPTWQDPLPHVIVLRGDEQLGLVAETCRDTITISTSDIERPKETDQPGDDFVVGLVRYAGEEMLILDSTQLFRRAVQRRERRRRRI